MSSIFDQYLDKNRANYAALSPVSFVERSEGTPNSDGSVPVSRCEPD